MGKRGMALDRIMGDDRGAVLIMVLIILIAVIIIGISVMRTTVIENAIAGNERVVITNFNLSESGIDFALHDYVSFTTSLGVIGGTYVYTTNGVQVHQLPSAIAGIDELKVRKLAVENPPTAGETGNMADANSVGGINELKAHFLLIQAREGNETIHVEAYKILPKGIED